MTENNTATVTIPREVYGVLVETYRAYVALRGELGNQAPQLTDDEFQALP